MSSAIIPSSNHNDFFLSEPTNINKTQYIENTFLKNPYYLNYTNIDNNTLITRLIKSRYIVSKIYYILTEKVKKEYDEQIKLLVYLEKEQLNDFIDMFLQITNKDFIYTILFTYLEKLKITQLIYLNQKLNFKKLSELLLNQINVSYDKIHNIDNILDINNPIYHELYYKSSFNATLINNQNTLLRNASIKTKIDYIQKYYLDNNYYSDKQNIIDYIKHIFNEFYISLKDTDENLFIDSKALFTIIYVLTQNNEWIHKFKWILYLLNHHHLVKLNV